ncbi:hypothetical protein PAHAL_5G472400 [Panicum hallii]|uniref:Uncharacterized protein n=1 Tax=Panicum hallii TaxID=206008 RepID=A0A2T8INM9_9POAL|nr:hypothetical protein PAHAL_5G472400 [Panicum hallii]
MVPTWPTEPSDETFDGRPAITALRLGLLYHQSTRSNFKKGPTCIIR